MKTILSLNVEEVNRIGLIESLSDLQKYSDEDLWASLFSKKEKAIIKSIVDSLKREKNSLPEITIGVREILILQKAIGFIKGKEQKGNK